MSQINIKEIARRLKSAMPGRSISVNVEYWCYKEGNDEAKFNVSVLPGLDGTDCSITRFGDADELNKWVDQTIGTHQRVSRRLRGLRPEDPARAT